MAAGPGATADQRRDRAALALLAASKGEPLSDDDVAALHAYDGHDLRDGLPLQLALARLWRNGGEELGGWKIGWTSGAARDRGGPGFRPFGFVLASRILPSGSPLSAAQIPAGALEPEISVTIGSRLAGPDVTTEQARAAVESVAPAFEVLSHRLPDGLSLAARIGNGLNNWGLVVGEPHAPDIALDSLPVEVRHDGTLLGSAVSNGDRVDDPFLSLARVTRELHAHGLALEPGQRLITGSITPSVKIEDGRYEATFGPLGSVAVDIRPGPARQRRRQPHRAGMGPGHR
jgi:2-keto-4-pentenoate hydratase